MADDTASRPRLSTRAKVILACIVLIIWTAMASSWTDKDCPFIPDSYVYVISHAGPPDSEEGCDAGEYTDQYYSSW